MPQVQPVSFAPKDFVAGGLINDVDVEVESAEFTVEPPPNYTAEALFAKLSLKVLPGGEIVDQWWSCGAKALTDFTPSDDGRTVIPSGASGAKSFTKDSNFYKLMDSLVAKGFPESKCNDLGNLKTLQMHVVQEAQKLRAGMSAPREGRENQVLVCERIIKLPGEKGKGKAAAAPKPVAKSTAAAAAPAAVPVAPAAESNGDYDAIAIETLKSLLAANNGTLETKAVRAQVFRAASGMKVEERNTVIRLVSDSAWLVSQGFLVDETSVAWIE